MAALQVFSRQGCHLCEVLIEELLPLVRGRLAVEIHDIDSREEWRRDYHSRVPVLEYEGAVICQYTLDRSALQQVLDAIARAG